MRREVAALLQGDLEAPLRALHLRIVEMSERCTEGSHLHLKLYGD